MSGFVRHLEKLSLLILTIFVVCACGSPSHPKRARATIQSQDIIVDKTVNNEKDNDTIDSLGAFEQTVYPLVVIHCSGCHASVVAPFFASDDVDTAYAAVVDGHKADFITPERSRLVERLSEDKHNCWSGKCEEDASVMLAAIEQWVKSQEVTLDSADKALISNSLRLIDGVASTVEEQTDSYVWEAEAFTSIEAPMVVVQNSDASGGASLHVPAGNGGRITDLNMQNNVGFVNYVVDIKQAGTYKLFARMLTPDGNSDSVFFSVDGSPFVYWNAGASGSEFSWVEATSGGQQEEFEIDLNAGQHMLTIRRREERAQLDMIALSRDPNFSGGSTTVEAEWSELIYDLSEVLGVGGEFRVKVRQFDDFSLIFQDPTIRLNSGRVHVKNISFLINGKSDPQASTYSIVDAVVNSPGEILSEASLVQPFDVDPNTDEIQVVIETLE